MSYSDSWETAITSRDHYFSRAEVMKLINHPLMVIENERIHWLCNYSYLSKQTGATLFAVEIQDKNHGQI